MNPMIKKLMEKKKAKGETLSPVHGKAKSGILQGLIDDMMGADSDKVKGLKKVTVASNSPEGLKHGLDKAKEIVANPDAESELADTSEEGGELEEGSEDEESSESAELEHDEQEIDDLKAQIEALKAKLESHNIA